MTRQPAARDIAAGSQSSTIKTHDTMDWLQLLNTVSGALVALGGMGIYKFFTKSGQKEIKADADAKVADAQAKMIDNYEERIKDLHENIQRLNEAERSYIERISEQNKAITGKNEQIRNLTQKCWESEQEVNRVQEKLNAANERIIGLTEERDFYKMWLCKSNTCVKGNPDPEGRQPPNPKLVGMQFELPGQ